MYAGPLQKSWIVKQLFYKELLIELDAHFNKMGVRYMPIKGAYLIISGLSEKIEFREMVDIDILVEQKNFKRVTEYFSKCEKATLKDDGWYFEQPFFYSFSGESILVEIHYLLNRPERFYLPTEKLFFRAEKRGDFLYLPCLEDAMAIAMCHSVVHISYGGFRDDVFSDMEAMSEAWNFSWNAFNEIVKETGIQKFIEFLFVLYKIKFNKCLNTDGKAHFRLFLLALIFNKWYQKFPVWARRFFFELPFIKDPWGLIILNLFRS